MNHAGVSRAPHTRYTGPSCQAPMRLCTGECRKRKSIGQFILAGTVCKVCRARAK